MTIRTQDGDDIREARRVYEDSLDLSLLKLVIADVRDRHQYGDDGCPGTTCDTCIEYACAYELLAHFRCPGAF